MSKVYSDTYRICNASIDVLRDPIEKTQDSDQPDEPSCWLTTVRYENQILLIQNSPKKRVAFHRSSYFFLTPPSLFLLFKYFFFFKFFYLIKKNQNFFFFFFFLLTC